MGIMLSCCKMPCLNDAVTVSLKVICRGIYMYMYCIFSLQNIMCAVHVIAFIGYMILYVTTTSKLQTEHKNWPPSNHKRESSQQPRFVNFCRPDPQSRSYSPSGAGLPELSG